MFSEKRFPRQQDGINLALDKILLNKSTCFRQSTNSVLQITSYPSKGTKIIKQTN